MTPPTATKQAPARPEVVTRGVPAARPAWLERATSADHKIVGQMYIATAFTFIALAAVEFALIRMQLFLPENSLIEPEIFNRLLTASISSIVVLGLVPLALGLIMYIVPLQIGARGTALPRLGQLSYWLYAMGGVTIYASFLWAAPETGSLALPPLSELTFSPSNGADAWIAGTALAVLGFTCFAVNMLATLNKLRAPGMAWRRMPLFSSAATVINWIVVVVGPIMIAGLTMLMIDRRFNGVFFDPGEGGAPVLYEHIGYIFLTACYLIVFLFAAGVISEILPTFARKPIFSHRAVTGSFVAVAVAGLLAWMQNMYTAPLNEGWTIGAMLFALGLLIPVGLIFYNWIATLWDGALRLRAASWYALLAISTMACGLAGEFGYSVIPVGWALEYTTASQGDTLYVLVGGGVFGGFAALHYWYPKLSGRLLGEGLGKAALGLMVVGIHLYVIPMFLAGLQGQPVDVWQYYEDEGLDTLNAIASLGAFALVAGILLALGNAAYSWNNGIEAGGHDPWGGSTLEWFALSPPPPHNFDAVPDVRSAEPLRDIRLTIAARVADYAPPPPLEVASLGSDPSSAPDEAEAEGSASDPASSEPERSDPAGSAEPPDKAPGESGESDSESTRVEEAEVEAQPQAPAEEEAQTPEADREDDDDGSVA